MFTGIIEDVGSVCEISSSKIAIETKLDAIAIGDSVAVNGVCLTAVSCAGGAKALTRFSADYSPHTDKVTNLSQLKKGSPVNLERALQLSSRLGGHIVSGHIDATAKIETIEKSENFFRIVFCCPKEVMSLLADKASIAVDGVSLTISKVLPLGFEIFIIPQTFNNTIFKFKKSASIVNIETDILAKYAQKAVNKEKGLTLEFLKENGF
ncbi:MAG: riboflavin synthase [Endomicrobium sp.]|jgi:riboflavin synthase|nr:riboflavin synthase [Endomicrobium sp.]